MKGDGEPRSRSFVLFHFWRCDQRGEALVELKQPLPLSSSSSLLDMAPCLASVSVKPQWEWAPHMKALWVHCKEKHFEESHKHPPHEWVGSDFVPCRCGQEN